MKLSPEERQTAVLELAKRKEYLREQKEELQNMIQEQESSVKK